MLTCEDTGGPGSGQARKMPAQNSQSSACQGPQPPPVSAGHQPAPASCETHRPGAAHPAQVDNVLIMAGEVQEAAHVLSLPGAVVV